MVIVSYFADSDSNPVIGLDPIIKIYDTITYTQTIPSGIMGEIDMTLDAGWYKYDFITVDLSHTYTINVDGGSTLENYLRYQNAIVVPEIPQRPIVDFGN
jgi:hypothetical protein